MSLEELPLLRRYRTGRHDLVRDFYVPCLSEARSYRRAVGYFTSGALALAAQGLSRLVERGGVVQLVASPHLQSEDIDALRRGVQARSDVIERALLRQLVETPLLAQQRRLELMAWLLAEGHLDIKIAVMAARQQGIFHEKIGILSDGRNAVAFTGSANETEAAHVGNFESFSVYRSWDPGEHSWVTEIDQDFNDLWHNATPGLEVLDLPEALNAAILRVAPADGYAPLPDPEDAEQSATTSERHPMGLPVAPANLQVRDYQRQAIRAWFDASGRGIFEMATGTGKTITALTLLQQLRRGLHERAGLPLVVLVVCPFVNLVSQWTRELGAFGVRPIVASESSDSWKQPLRDVLAGVRLGAMDFAAVVTTNSTLAGRAFQGLVDQFPKRTLVIADEVHNLGTERLAAALPASAYRLGLSATPDRWMDDEGSQRIRDYFGPSVFQLPLQEAITQGYLCPYDYYPLVVNLQDDERERYLELSLKIARLAAIGGAELAPATSGGALQLLLFERSRLIGAARNKLGAALQAAGQHRSEGGLIVYCSDAAEFGEAQGHSMRQIDQVVRGLCLPPISIAAARYTYNESPRVRAALERQFADGVLDALVAIRCLDEGVDIPSMRTAIIMASTTNPKQFVQRRGRVLRRFPGKDKATIYDLVVSPGDPAELPPDVFNVERRIFRRELMRVVEFARSAENSSEILHDLLALRTAWNCLDI